MRARLTDLKLKREEQEARQARGEQIVGLGRGDRVRTYNYPQDRVTDHRIGENVSGLDVFMEGEGMGLAHFIDELEERTRTLQMEGTAPRSICTWLTRHQLYTDRERAYGMHDHASDRGTYRATSQVGCRWSLRALCCPGFSERKRKRAAAWPICRALALPRHGRGGLSVML